jgi:hypothetical protein
MSRFLPAVIINAINSKVINPFFAIDLYFQSETVYLWTGYGELVIGAKTYLGVGSLLNISSVEETTEIEAKGATLTLSGIPSSILSLALDEPFQGRLCKIYFGVTDIPTSYMEIFAGELDQMNIVEEAATCTVSVTAENVLIKLERPTVRRFTDQDQKSRYPGDRGLEYIASLQNREIFWGRAVK